MYYIVNCFEQLDQIVCMRVCIFSLHRFVFRTLSILSLSLTQTRTNTRCCSLHSMWCFLSHIKCIVTCMLCISIDVYMRRWFSHDIVSRSFYFDSLFLFLFVFFCSFNEWFHKHMIYFKIEYLLHFLSLWFFLCCTSIMLYAFIYLLLDFPNWLNQTIEGNRI